MCGKLRVSLYGTRDAAKNWEDEFGSKLVVDGLLSKAGPIHDFNALRTKRMVAAVHDVSLKIQSSKSRSR